MWIQELGMPGHSLMEIAGRKAAEHIILFSKKQPLILCGSGNNGGDGYVVARWLKLWGANPIIWQAAPPKTEDCIRNAKIAQDIGIEQCSALPAAHDGMIIDALLGTGQNRPPQGSYRQAIDWILKRPRNKLVCLDLPTGFGNGELLSETPINPSLCLSFGALKKSLYVGHNTGEIKEIDLGFSHVSPHFKPAGMLIDNTLPSAQIPDYAPKWQRGHVAIRASRGAAVLAAHAALKMGAGLVSVLTPKDEWHTLRGLKPEIMVLTPEELNLSRHDALVVGPAMGLHHKEEILKYWTECPKPTVFDADALRILASSNIQPSTYPRIITPHSAEAAALLGWKHSEVLRRPFSALSKLSSIALTLLKGHHCKVSAQTPYVYPNPAPRLATAGSGDVLCGMIGSLLAQKNPPLTALINAVYTHAEAGRELLHGDGASDLISALRPNPQETLV